MEYLLIFFCFFIFILSSFYAAQSYSFFLWYRKTFGYKSFFQEIICNDVRGSFQNSGYYAQGHRIISKAAYNTLRNSEKMKFSYCFNIVKFRTKDSSWEIFSYLVKEGFSFNEMMVVRCFPDKMISNEATVERVGNNISIFSSSRFLSETLEQRHLVSVFEWLIRKETDSFIINNNTLLFKMFSEPQRMRKDKVMNALKALQSVKKDVFGRDDSRF